MRRLKKIIENIIGICIANIKYALYKSKCNQKKQKQYILFSVPYHGNLGDQAITYAEEKILESYNIEAFEITMITIDWYIGILKKKLPHNATLMINGGGFLGSHWFNEEKDVRKVICNFPNNKIIIFPQTIFYEDTEFGQKQMEESKKIYNKHQNLTIFAREEKSYKIMQEIYQNCKIFKIPDIVLYLQVNDLHKNRNSIILCLRKDKEKKIDINQEKIIMKTVKKKEIPIIRTDTVLDKNISKKKRNLELKKKFDEFQKAKIVITDRLHGMIFSYINKTPCIVLGNYNYKVEGVYKWIEKCNYIKFVKDIQNFENEFDNIINIKEKKSLRLFNEFDLLKEILFENGE